MIILRNVDMFLEDLDEQTKDYYQKVATEIEKRLRTPPPKNFDNYYIDKIKPFFVNQEIYYEVALEPADEKPNKFNRITAFTKYDISTDYCVALSFSDATISVFNTDFPIKIITEWHVSIRPCELNNFAELLKGFCIGHSYFCGKDVCTDEWLHSIVDYDILPMLSEYWFDDTSKLRRWENILQGMFQ